MFATSCTDRAQKESNSQIHHDNITAVKRGADRLINLVSTVALIAFSCFVVYNAGPIGPWLWVPSAFIGAIYYDHVKSRITDLFFNKLSWMWLIPTNGILYGLFWPQTIILQAIITGLDMGSRWSIYGQEWFQRTASSNFLCFRV